MAEAIALSLVSEISARLEMIQVYFFTDNLILANFLNGVNRENPPDWKIRSYTQSFINHEKNRIIQVMKIERSQNLTAHILASQAFRLNDPCAGTSNVTCTNPAHELGCPLSQALKDVIPRHCTQFAATCCQ